MWLCLVECQQLLSFRSVTTWKRGASVWLKHWIGPRGTGICHRLLVCSQASHVASLGPWYLGPVDETGIARLSPFIMSSGTISSLGSSGIPGHCKWGFRLCCRLSACSKDNTLRQTAALKAREVALASRRICFLNLATHRWGAVWPLHLTQCEGSLFPYPEEETLLTYISAALLFAFWVCRASFISTGAETSLTLFRVLHGNMQLRPAWRMFQHPRTSLGWVCWAQGEKEWVGGTGGGCIMVPISKGFAGFHGFARSYPYLSLLSMCRKMRHSFSNNAVVKVHILKIFNFVYLLAHVPSRSLAEEQVKCEGVTWAVYVPCVPASLEHLPDHFQRNISAFKWWAGTSESPFRWNTWQIHFHISETVGRFFFLIGKSGLVPS